MGYRHTLHAPRLLGAILALVLLGSLIPVASVLAAATVTAATGGGAISSDTNSGGGTGAYTSLTGPAINGTGAGDLTLGTVVLTLPAGFEFNPAGGTAAVSGAGCGGLAASAVTYSASNTKATTTLSGGPSTGACSVTFSGLQVRPTAGTPLASGAITNTGTTGPASGYGTLTEVPGAPFTVSFNPAFATSSTGGVAFSTQPKVRVQDKAGNDVPGVPVTLTIAPGTPTSGGPGTLTCTTNPLSTGSPAYADAQFAGCSIDKAGTGYKLRATSGAAFVDSGAFNITVGPASKLVFSSFPAPSTPSLLTPQPTVQVVDAGGNLVTTASNAITLTTNQNNAQFTCTGTTTKAAVNGVAAFSGCTETVVANGYILTAAASGLTSGTSPSFNVVSGPASKLAICWGVVSPCATTPPSTITGGTAFPVQPLVVVQDVDGNTVVSDNTTVVTLGILAGTPTAGGPGVLTCTTASVTVVNGVGTFAGCKIDKAGTAYRLNATSTPVLTAGQSQAFNVAVGPAVKLGFSAQPPATATAGAPFPSTVQVAIQDAGGNTVTAGITSTVVLTFGSNPGGGTLNCTGGTSAATVNGVATFSGCTISSQGNGYTLVATATGTSPVTTLTPATSTAINVLAPAAAITLTPSSTVIVWGQDVLLNVHFGVNGAGKQFTIQVSKDGVTWSNIAGATLTTNGSGDASFTYGPSDNRYYRVNFGGTPDLQAGTSPIVRVVVRQINVLRPAPGSAEHHIRPGTTISFTSTIRPNRPELPQAVAHYVVYQLKSTGWTRVLDQMVPVNRTTGVAALNITFNTTGRFYVRSEAVPTAFNANSGWSGLVRYLVS